MQSFLGSLNYYSRFIEDFAIYASVLYELREADFHGIRRMEKMESPTPNEKRAYDRRSRGDSDPDRIGVTGGDPDCFDVTGGDLNLTDRSRWKKAIILFTMLKDKIAKTLILKHFDCGSSSSDRSLC